ncbi:CD3324 family protein [Terrisporobacter petrolearius]|uniref:CD3324 family protein n=1 Tax=Terrisporobacter petrolearius TaxID=1460447 RepID=UPI003B0060B6
MKYENANDILPSYIIEILQEYIDGKYLYIPRKENNKKSWGEESGFRQELNNRNRKIIKEYNNGKTVKEISKDYYLTEHSIRRIIRDNNK